MNNHISKEQYDQLPDTEKSGWREQRQYEGYSGNWIDYVNGTQELWDALLGADIDTRLVYVHVQPKKQEIETVEQAAERILDKLSIHPNDPSSYDGFIAGANWQRQQTIQEVKEILEAEVWEDPIGNRIKSRILTQLNNLKL